MKNTTLNNLTANGSFAVQLAENIPAPNNLDILAYCAMTGGMNLANRYFAFDKNNTVGRKIFYFISVGYFEQFKNLQALKLYVKLNKVWADTVHHQTPIHNEEGEVIDQTDVTNKEHYQAIEIDGDYYVLLTDENHVEFMVDFTYDGDNKPEQVFELPIVEQEEVI